MAHPSRYKSATGAGDGVTALLSPRGCPTVFRIERDYTVEAARRLPRLPAEHPCHRLHGHRFTVTLAIEGDNDNEQQWVADYYDVDAAYEVGVGSLIDHNYLNDVAGLENPTTEVLARWVFERLEPALPGLVEVIVAEEGDTRCAYRPG